MVRMAVAFASIAAPLQLLIGDQHGLDTLKYRPMKIAAMEAHWDGSAPAPLVLFAWPDETAETNRYAITIPNGASLVLTHSWNGLVPGLKSVPSGERPPVVPPFFAFRIMVAIGLLMIAVALTGAYLWWQGRLLEAHWYLRVVQHFWWTGFVAVIAGWIVTETGRQPWIAYGVLRTADAVSPHAASTVATTLVLFVLVYGIVFAMGLYYINRLIVRGPQGLGITKLGAGTPTRPISAAEEAGRQALRITE